MLCSWVLTSAHCVGTATQLQVTMEFGNIVRTRGNIHSSTRVLRHPQYDSDTTGVNLANDIAVSGLVV